MTTINGRAPLGNGPVGPFSCEQFRADTVRAIHDARPNAYGYASDGYGPADTGPVGSGCPVRKVSNGLWVAEWSGRPAMSRFSPLAGQYTGLGTDGCNFWLCNDRRSLQDDGAGGLARWLDLSPSGLVFLPVAAHVPLVNSLGPDGERACQFAGNEYATTSSSVFPKLAHVFAVVASSAANWDNASAAVLSFDLANNAAVQAYQSRAGQTSLDQMWADGANTLGPGGNATSALSSITGYHDWEASGPTPMDPSASGNWELGRDGAQPTRQIKAFVKEIIGFPTRRSAAESNKWGQLLAALHATMPAYTTR